MTVGAVTGIVRWAVPFGIYQNNHAASKATPRMGSAGSSSNDGGNSGHNSGYYDYGYVQGFHDGATHSTSDNPADYLISCTQDGNRGYADGYREGSAGQSSPGLDLGTAVNNVLDARSRSK